MWLMSSILCSLNQNLVRFRRDFGSWLFLLLQRIDDFCVLMPWAPVCFERCGGEVITLALKNPDDLALFSRRGL